MTAQEIAKGLLLGIMFAIAVWPSEKSKYEERLREARKREEAKWKR